MNIEDFRVFWQEYNEALMARDVDRVLACYTEDIVYDESPMMMSEPRRGKEQCGAYWSQVFAAFSSIAISTTSIVYDDDRLIIITFNVLKFLDDDGTRFTSPNDQNTFTNIFAL